MLALCGGAAMGLVIQPSWAKIKPAHERNLAFYNTHTGERAAIVYWAEGEYLTDALTEVDQLLRDHRTGDVHPIDPRLLDVLYTLQHKINTRKPFHVISGYRSPATNALLRTNSNGVAKKSLHMQGKAIDIRLPGYGLKDLQKAALSLRAGGVGYYPQSNFIHVDTGRVRSW